MRKDTDPAHTDPVQDARVAIWRLFDEGYVDEDMATAGLLALDLGMRRARRGPPATKPPQGRTRADHPAKSR